MCDFVAGGVNCLELSEVLVVVVVVVVEVAVEVVESDEKSIRIRVD